MKLIRSFLCFLVLALAYSPCILFAQEGNIHESLGTEKFTNYENSIKSISKGQYTWGGVTSIIPGFGLGHALQGRYMERGWIFTASELVTFGGGIVSAFYTISLIAVRKGMSYPSLKSETAAMRNLSISLFVIFAGLKAWEIYDAWVLPFDYKVVDSSFKIQPLAFYNQGSTSLGLSLQYEF